jgi:branched-chain amino acid transport system permease protein
MAGTFGSESTVARPSRLRWQALRPTLRTRRQIFRAVVTAALFVALCAGLTVSFGVGILVYVLTGFAVSSIVIVAAMGLTLVYGIRGFANFAYGDLMSLGAYSALIVNLLAGFALVWGAIVSFLALALVGIFLEIVIFSRLEGRGFVAPLVASVGVGLIIQNGIRAIATTRQWTFAVAGSLDIPIVPGLGIHPTRHILTLSVGIAFVVSAHILLKYTNLGKAMRATADNLELAKATGIDTRKVRFAAWAVSCSFASTAGVLLGLNAVISPTMGFDQILLIFAAVIVGGIGSPYGAMIGGLVVGLSQEMSVPFLDWLGRPEVIGLEHATAYKVAVPFFIMIGVLLLRPWGIAGRQPAFAPRTFFLERLSRLRTHRAVVEQGEENARGG